MSGSAALNVAVLDDYQHVAPSLADWASLQPQANTVFFHDHVSDADALAARLAPFDAVVLMRERTRFDANLLARLPRLKLIVSVGMWNAAIDLDAAKSRGIVVSGTTGGDAASNVVMGQGRPIADDRSGSERAGNYRSRGVFRPGGRSR